ncbi:helix-turn-helix transcriptional regulator [Longicatena sp. 210702-DFI.1.36]|uniref:helix-turn-helix domain-containing protein n=1 Tax=Longicatena caecimuris TaxID=1796635 RepID=UPI0009DB5C77|nr:helix-turn-helix transcriptional regulator [Eubacterium sp.]MCB5395407.1 helix-turn-helix transcriptional regulator [Longicatena caecimuris]MCB6265765.1 helix-turn-helix transcriptional regulator [Longicatena sp. 210702-DFI.1.160]MCB6316286.1 helix-turn-helix transcriptional regulator [Longicatena sp. 210702-DFI.1.100]MCB6430743.1 helix-turn-helix transcriptional regulator [Longicatena sp. 210702-DFI.1.36]MCB6433191.1 helix-turn-helix transcriptional regulator [Longicatena sp. 210702-DFI.1.
MSSLLSQHTKNSFTNILAEYRVEKAKQLLLNNRKIKEVSSLVGFQNQNYFAKTFKKVTGYTPKEYKQMHVMKDI